MRIIIELNKDQDASVVQQNTGQTSGIQERALNGGMPSALLLEERGRDSAYPTTSNGSLNNGSTNAGIPTQDLLATYENGSSGSAGNSAQVINAGSSPTM